MSGAPSALTWANDVQDGLADYTRVEPVMSYIGWSVLSRADTPHRNHPVPELCGSGGSMLCSHTEVSPA